MEVRRNNWLAATSTNPLRFNWFPSLALVTADTTLRPIRLHLLSSKTRGQALLIPIHCILQLLHANSSLNHKLIHLETIESYTSLHTSRFPDAQHIVHTAHQGWIDGEIELFYENVCFFVIIHHNTIIITTIESIDNNNNITNLLPKSLCMGARGWKDLYVFQLLLCLQAPQKTGQDS